MTEALTHHAAMVAAVLALAFGVLVATFAVIALSCVSPDDDLDGRAHHRRDRRKDAIRGAVTWIARALTRRGKRPPSPSMTHGSNP